MTVCSETFLELARLQAQSLGMPNLAILTVPHPIGGIDLKEVVKKADDALEEMIEVLTMPREKLAERAKKQSDKGSGR